MQKRFYIFLILACICLTFAQAYASENARHFEIEGGFSYIPPSGWKVIEFPGYKYKIAAGTPIKGFAPNINIADGIYEGSMDNYVKSAILMMKQNMKKFKLVKEEPFLTKNRLKSAKIIVENEQDGRLLKQIFYLFPHKNRTYVATGTLPASVGNKLDLTLDSCMKTFRFEK